MQFTHKELGTHVSELGIQVSYLPYIEKVQGHSLSGSASDLLSQV